MRVDFGGDEPADAEDGCGEVEDGDAGDAGGEERNVEVGSVCCETAVRMPKETISRRVVSDYGTWRYSGVILLTS